MKPETKFKPSGIRPSDEQSAIQVATQREILIQANAGAAKTTTLALRIAESLLRGVAPEQMLVLTMTEAAQQVMALRLRQIGVAADKIKRLQICTFEQLAQQCLFRFESSTCPYLPNEESMREVAFTALQHVAQMYPQYELDLQFNNQALHQFLLLQAQLKARFALYQHDFEGYSAEEIAHVLNIPLTCWLWFVELESLRGEETAAEFRGEFDASYDLARLLHLHPEYCATLPAYTNILCDELHDINEVCFRILLALIRRGSAFFCGAGDKDQVIYSWRGAEHSFMQQRFHAEFPRLKEYPLTACYRYGEQLADAVAHFKQKKNTSALQQEGAVVLRAYEGGDDFAAQGCAQIVLKEIRAWCKPRPGEILGQTLKPRLGEIAVLLRHPGQSIAIESLLLQENLAYQTEGMSSFLLRAEILVLRALGAIAYRNMGQVLNLESRRHIFEALTAYAEMQVPEDDYQTWAKEWDKICRDVIEQPQALEWFFSGKILPLARYSGPALQKAVEYLRSLPPDANAGQALAQVCADLKLADIARRLYVDREQAAYVEETLTRFLAMAHKAGLNGPDFFHWLGQAESKVTGRHGRDTLLLACVDAIKGKEFACVIMPYLDLHAFPRARVQLREEENRFYVALTRCQTHLVLCAPQQKELCSPFLRRLRLGKPGPQREQPGQA